MSSGFLLIFFGHFYESNWVGILMLTLGATVIAVAHYRNWNFLKKSTNCYPGLIMNKDSDQTECKKRKAA